MKENKIRFEKQGNGFVSVIMIDLRLPVCKVGGSVINLQYGQVDGKWIARATPLALGTEVRVVDGLTTQEQAEACALECGRQVVSQIKDLWVLLKKGEPEAAIRSAVAYGKDAKCFRVNL